jgi:hypothetical protein
MGNPNILHRAGEPPRDDRERGNGILARMGGTYVSAGSDLLPPADASQQDQPERRVVIDVPGLGAVRITYRLQSYRHYKNKFWRWSAEHAEVVEPGT